jgi:hypothetical protein
MNNMLKHLPNNIANNIYESVMSNKKTQTIACVTTVFCIAELRFHKEVSPFLDFPDSKGSYVSEGTFAHYQPPNFTIKAILFALAAAATSTVCFAPAIVSTIVPCFLGSFAITAHACNLIAPNYFSPFNTSFNKSFNIFTCMLSTLMFGGSAISLAKSHS